MSYRKTTQPSFASRMQRAWTSGLTRPSSQWPCGQSTTGDAGGIARGPIEVAAEEEAGQGLQRDLLDRVAVALDLAEDLRDSAASSAASARGRA